MDNIKPEYFMSKIIKELPGGVAIIEQIGYTEFRKIRVSTKAIMLRDFKEVRQYDEDFDS